MRSGAAIALLVALTACKAPPPRLADAAPAAPATPAAADVVTISIVGTSDIHGHVQRDGAKGGLDVLGGYLANLRAARAKDRGGVVLVDAGDMFQGTLESNLGEGMVMVEAMNRLGYAAAAVGNHEFDFGPVGPAPTPRAPGDDPRGALKAYAAAARFPLLAANILDHATGKPVAWPNVMPSVLVEAGGVQVGIVGVTTEATKHTTMAANVADLDIAPLADTIAAEARALRGRGAAVVVVAAHAGGSCAKLDAPDDPAAAACDPDQEIMRVAAALPPGVVDVIVAGHTHKAMATRVNGIAVVQAWPSGTAFSRVDLRVDRAAGKVLEARILPPRDVTLPAEYEGAPVTPDAAVLAFAEDDLARANAVRGEPLGVTLAAEVTRSYDKESAEGNLFADLMLEAIPGVAVALQNGGGLRADLPAGPLTYGALYEAYPFDNRFAKVTVTGRQLRAMIAANLQKKGGILSLGGLRARAECRGGELVVTLTRPDGTPVRDGDRFVVALSDFLATGGDGLLASAGLGPEDASILDDAPLLRDGLAAALRKRKGTIRPEALYDPKKPRLAYPGQRPVTCR
jgi:5'-nucleotidase